MNSWPPIRNAGKLPSRPRLLTLTLLLSLLFYVTAELAIWNVDTFLLPVRPLLLTIVRSEFFYTLLVHTLILAGVIVAFLVLRAIFSLSNKEVGLALPTIENRPKTLLALFIPLSFLLIYYHLFPWQSGQGVSVALSAAIMVIAATSEEVYFRGVVQSIFTRILSPTGAIVIQATLFTLIHIGMMPVDALLFFVFPTGLALGASKYWSGSLLPGITAHWLYNITSILLAS
jgi:membrane protease YdiL (CAAX protease family)